MPYKLTTNNKPRDLLAFHELPESAKQLITFNGINLTFKNSLRFVKYLGEYYDTYNATSTFHFSNKGLFHLGWATCRLKTENGFAPASYGAPFNPIVLFKFMTVVNGFHLTLNRKVICGTGTWIKNG